MCRLFWGKMMTEFDTHEKVSELVPHKGKMHLLSRVVSYDVENFIAETEVDVNEKSMFYEDIYDGVPVWIAFEYMAQSVSVLIGIVCKKMNLPPKMGFILSVTNFQAYENVFRNGETVRLWVKQLVRVDKAVTFEGRAFVNDKLIATATMNTIEVDDPKQVLGV